MSSSHLSKHDRCHGASRYVCDRCIAMPLAHAVVCVACVRRYTRVQHGYEHASLTRWRAIESVPKERARAGGEAQEREREWR
eukprot:2565292-Pleurochrysis_carterae.AAC.2